MSVVSINLTLPTPHGDASFTLSADPAGVTVERLPLQGLPNSVWQLTYGKQWKEAQGYFTQLAATLPFRLMALATSDRMVVASLDAAVRLLPPAGIETGAYRDFWASHSKQLSLFSTEEAQLTGALDAFRQLARRREVGPFSPHLLPYLQTLLPIAGHRVLVLVYAAIGALASAEAKELLLGELESEGRHPYTDKILSALASFNDADTLQRLIGVYRADKIAEEDLDTYIGGLGRFEDTASIDHVLDLLADHPEAVPAITNALGQLGMSTDDIAGHLHRQFLRETRYGLLDDLLIYTNLQHADEHRIGLAQMNARAADPVFTDTPPVNWPQQLEPGWRHLVAGCGAEEVFLTVAAYLSRSEPRLQRNAILQLKAYRQLPGAVNELPHSIEVRLRELLFSRFDKVYVEVLNILGDRPIPLAEHEAMLRAVLEVSIGSRYRFVVLNALRKVGGGAGDRAYASTFYLQAINAAETPSRLQQVADLLPFLEKYLGDVAALREALDARPR